MSLQYAIFSLLISVRNLTLTPLLVSFLNINHSGSIGTNIEGPLRSPQMQTVSFTFEKSSMVSLNISSLLYNTSVFSSVAGKYEFIRPLMMMYLHTLLSKRVG